MRQGPANGVTHVTTCQGAAVFSGARNCDTIVWAGAESEVVKAALGLRMIQKVKQPDSRTCGRRGRTARNQETATGHSHAQTIRGPLEGTDHGSASPRSAGIPSTSGVRKSLAAVNQLDRVSAARKPRLRTQFAGEWNQETGDQRRSRQVLVIHGAYRKLSIPRAGAVSQQCPLLPVDAIQHMWP